MPYSGLFADPDFGVGLVQMSDAFEAIEPAQRIQILADWQRGLAELRVKAFECLVERELLATRGQAPEQRLERLRAVASALGQN